MIIMHWNMKFSLNECGDGCVAFGKCQSRLIDYDWVWAMIDQLRFSVLVRTLILGRFLKMSRMIILNPSNM